MEKEDGEKIMEINGERRKRGRMKIIKKIEIKLTLHRLRRRIETGMEIEKEKGGI